MVTRSAKLAFSLPYAHSLKEKRRVARSLIDKARSKFNASIAEVDTQDLHQTLTVGVAVVSGNGAHAQIMLDEIVRCLENTSEAELTSVWFDCN